MRRFAVGAVLVALLAAAACSIMTNLDDLRRGEGDGGSLPDAPVGDGSSVKDGGDGAAPACNPGTVPNLIGYYNFDEGAGDVVHDCSGKGHDGTILRVGGSTWGTGIKGGGLRVLAPDGCVDLGAVADFEMKSGFTVMAWADALSFPASFQQAIVGKTSDLNAGGWRNYAGFVQEIGSGVARAGDAGPLYVGIEPVDAGVWRHIATVYDMGAKLTIYVDGVNVAEKAWTTPLIDDKTTNVRIGCRGDNAGFFDGTIDEVRIYNRALTPSEVAKLSAP